MASEIQEALWRAVVLLDRQRNRMMYPIDKQIQIQKDVKEFIERWK